MSAPVGTGPTTYQALFSDPTKDPSGVEPEHGYNEIFSRWRVEANAPSADELHMDVLTDFDSIIGAVGYFVKDNHFQSGVLKVCHGFRKFAGIPGRPTADRGDTFGYVGDVVSGTDITSFKVDPAQFEVVTETRCANTPERHLELFEAEPDRELIPPIEESSQAQRMIKTRRSMFIPYCLVEYVIDQDLSARDAFEILWPVIVQKNLREICKPLVNFLMVAATKPGIRSSPRTVNDQLGLGITGAADVVSDRRQRVLYQHLPALMPNNVPTTSIPRMDDLVSQLSQLNNQARLDRVARQEARDLATKPKSVREKFGDYVTDRLLMLTDSADDEDLPRVYHELAARQKGVNKRLLVQQCFDIAAQEFGVNKLPVASTHVIDLDNWDFIGTSYDAIGTGLLPFSVVPPDAPSKAGKKALLEEQERIHLYDLSGEAVSGAISSTDAKKLYNNKGYVPTEWTEASTQIESYVIILAVVLGSAHRAIIQYMKAVNMYGRVKTRLQAAMNKKFGAKAAPALLVLYFQLNVRSWFEERWTFDLNDREAPELLDGLQSYIRSNRFDWLPSHEDIPALEFLTSGREPASSGEQISGGSTAAQTGTPRMSNAPAPASAPNIINRVQNPNRDVRFIGNTPFAVNIRTRSIRNAITVANVDPPQVTRGGRLMPTCLSWHVKGSCSEECARKADHVANTAEEKEQLHSWCLRAFA
jgi:hypothetical protein